MSGTLKIGVFGTRGHGKTVAMTAWQAVRDGDGVSLKALGAETMQYLRPLAEGLVKGEFPPPNPANQPSVLRWEVRTGGATAGLECIDFAGELADPIWNSGPAEFRHHVEKWMGQCDALLLFIDGTREQDPQYYDALDNLFQVLKQQRTQHGGKRRVIAAVVTKADALPGATPKNLGEAATEVLLAAHRLYHRVKEQLTYLGDSVIHKTFLTSAVGWQYATLPKHQRKLQPCNLFAPLHWVTENAGQVITQDRNRRRLGWMYAAALFLLLLSTLWYLSSRAAERGYTRFDDLVKARPADDQVHDRLTYYEEQIASRRFDWLWGLRGRRRKADQQAEKDRQIAARLEAADKLAQLLRKDMDLARDKKHASRHQAALNYLARYGAVTPQSGLELVKKLKEETQEAFNRDSQEWQTASGMRLQRPTDAIQKIEKLNAYASREDPLHGEEAKQMAQELNEEALRMRDRAVRGAANVLE